MVFVSSLRAIDEILLGFGVYLKRGSRSFDWENALTRVRQKRTVRKPVIR